MEAPELIAALGGRVELAAALGVSRDRVRMWSQRGRFPWEQHDPLLDFAEERGVPLTREQLRELSTTRKSPTASDRSGQVGQQPLE